MGGMVEEGARRPCTQGAGETPAVPGFETPAVPGFESRRWRNCGGIVAAKTWEGPYAGLALNMTCLLSAVMYGCVWVH